MVNLEKERSTSQTQIFPARAVYTEGIKGVFHTGNCLYRVKSKYISVGVARDAVVASGSTHQLWKSHRLSCSESYSCRPRACQQGQSRDREAWRYQIISGAVCLGLLGLLAPFEFASCSVVGLGQWDNFLDGGVLP